MAPKKVNSVSQHGVTALFWTVGMWLEGISSIWLYIRLYVKKLPYPIQRVNELENTVCPDWETALLVSQDPGLLDHMVILK